MAENVISLRKHKIKVVEKLIKEYMEKNELKFTDINDQFLFDHAQNGHVTFESLLQTVWMLAESMDKLEFEFLKFKVDIVNLLNGGEVK